ncbi:prolyl oligopeptidase family serine peptidase [Ochrobactrum daejeonense]|nr:prolyl oligopeptidase family serine peptidase [Brucella daejeonensis]
MVGLFAAAATAKTPIMKSSPTDDRGWKDALRSNDAGFIKSQAPVLVIQGTVDTIVVPDDSRTYVARAAQVGTDIAIKWVEKAGHRDLFESQKGLIIDRIAEGFEKKRN